MARKPTDIRCSFCGKSKDQARRLVAGPGVFICDECVALCNEVLNDEPPAAPPVGDAKGEWVKKTRGPSWLRRWLHVQELQPG